MAINRVIIEGNLTRDVEMRATASRPRGRRIHRRGQREAQERRGRVRRCPRVRQVLPVRHPRREAVQVPPQGHQVTIDGKLRYSQWTKDDEKRHELSVIVDQLEFSGGKREQTGDAPAPELDLYDEDIPF